MNKQKDKEQLKLTSTKKLLFNFILISIPFLLLSSGELILRIINYGDNLKLFIDYPGKETVEHRIINPVIGKKYFQKLEYTNPCHDLFLKEKPENGFRVFVMGSSTVLGFPYDENLMFSRILEERLQDSYPEKYIEVINTAMTAINSHTLLDFIDEVLKEEPDAILIYAGHNEFYGALGLGSVEKANKYRGLTFLHLDLLSFRFYQLLRSLISGSGELISGNKTGKSVRGTLMKIIADNKEIPYKGDIYNKVIERYEKNMGKLLKKAKRKNVPVFISEVVSNIKDLEPFCSVTAGGYPPAAEKYNEGKISEEGGDFEKAKKDYYRAKDLDCIRFRASEEINEIIHSLAAQCEAYLVPMKSSYFEEASPNKLIGSNLITEHVHPNIDGYFLMADAFFNKLAESKLIGEKLNIVYYKNSAYYQRNWGYTELDSLLGVHRVNSIKYYWPFQPLDAPFTDYREVYNPTSLVDSLAFAIIRSPDFKTYEAHQKMADFYKQGADFYNAFREYNAAVKCNPFQVKDYLEAANCLIKINDIPLALKILNKSLELMESFYAYFKKGELLIIKGDYKEAVEALEKARELDGNHENEEIILAKLYEAYLYGVDDKKTKEILNELKEINHGYQPRVQEVKADYVYFVPVQVESQIRKAMDFYHSGNDDAALDILLKSLEIKETSIANRVVGDILIRRNDKNSILYYLKAYPDYKNDINFLFDLGILYLSYRVTDKAQEILEEMKRLDRDNKKTSMLEEKILARK